MSSDLPFDLIALVIDTVGDSNDKDVLKKLALVSHSFLQICNKHLFANIELHDAYPLCNRPSSKKGFIKLLEHRPDLVKYIRKLTYNVSPPFHGQLREHTEDHLLSPILPNLLHTISRLKCLTIGASKLDWTSLDPSLTSALLHLMHLPTINRINLSFINYFPLSSLTPCVNLHQLDIYYLESAVQDHEDTFAELDMPIRIHQFGTSDSSLLTRDLLHAKRRDGEPAFDFTDLKQLSTSFHCSKDERNTRYLLQNAKHLEKLQIFVESGRLSLAGLHDILSPSARNLRSLELTMPLCDDDTDQGPLAGLCVALEAMAGNNVLENLAFEVNVDGYESADDIGYMIQEVEKVLVKPGWPALKQVSVKISIACCLERKETTAELRTALQRLPDKYLGHILTLKCIGFDYSASIVKCAFDLT